ncbi:hypothetical protein EDC36_103176 [Tepidimonas ignava]|uniref:Uncharacterized protein n=1 Tax=Tepidimonas ignava TaxID=114249 RepID=A0A4R3LGH9_9BURK|nr:hypothetical protein [Tepidimonas ignava]TCS99112.1 hypothetical protein EDC36_103176 [Tepidimonas ignava]TSE22804.1 hypothetical protein Tigna_00779 [Tepidimonas ignava]
MGRYISSQQSTSSDVRYALCNFGSNAAAVTYRLLNEEFLPARNIPDVRPVPLPSAISLYGGYGTVSPSGYGLAMDPVFTLGGAYHGRHNSADNAIYFDGAIQQAFGYGGAHTAPGTNNNGWSNYTGRCGEFGHDHWNLDAKGALLLPRRSPSYGVETKTELNDAFVNGDLSDRSLTLLLWSGALYLARRAEAEAIIVSNGTRGFISRFVVPGLPSGFYGTASYNRARNELVILGGSSATSSSGMWLRLYRNLPELDATSDLNAILSAITTTQISISWSGWTPSNDAEAVGGATPVLTDNGDVFVGFFNAGTALYVVRFQRTGDTTFGAPSNHVSYGVTTSYGRHSSRGSGMQVMQTRDGNTVAFYGQYYYYGAGLGVITVNKRSNSARAMYSDSETSNGRSLLHWGETGFAVAFHASGNFSAHGNGAAYGYDCSVQTATVSPTQFTLSIPNGYTTAAPHPFFVEVNL